MGIFLIKLKQTQSISPQRASLCSAHCAPPWINYQKQLNFMRKMLLSRSQWLIQDFEFVEPLPVLPRKRLRFVPLTSHVFVLIQHFLLKHRTRYFMRCAGCWSSIVLPRLLQSLTNQSLHNCFASYPTIVGHGGASPGITWAFHEMGLDWTWNRGQADLCWLFPQIQILTPAFTLIHMIEDGVDKSFSKHLLWHLSSLAELLPSTLQKKQYEMPLSPVIMHCHY